MAYRYKTMEQLKDSQLLYNKKPPRFGLGLIFIVLIALVGFLLWSAFTPRIYVVRGAGSVASKERNYIMSSYTGEIIEAYVLEGDYVERGDVLFKISSTDLDLQAQQISGMIEVNEVKIQQYELLEQCIKDGVNRFNQNDEDDKPYYYQYETYINQIEQKEIDVSSYVAYGYTDEQIDAAIKTNEAAISEIYYTTLKNISDSIQGLQTEIDSYEVQLASVNNAQAEYCITASVSGIVHMDTEYKVGMVVQAATAIGSIVNENDGYVASVYITANDMPLIQVGDTVDIAISGLTQTIYGTIGGKVTYIAPEATVNSEENSSAFLAKIELDSTYLVSNQGNIVNISNGMAVEARVHYDEVTYLNYILESLGILLR